MLGILFFFIAITLYQGCTLIEAHESPQEPDPAQESQQAQLALTAEVKKPPPHFTGQESSDLAQEKKDEEEVKMAAEEKILKKTDDYMAAANYYWGVGGTVYWRLAQSYYDYGMYLRKNANNSKALSYEEWTKAHRAQQESQLKDDQAAKQTAEKEAAQNTAKDTRDLAKDLQNGLQASEKTLDKHEDTVSNFPANDPDKN